MHRVACVILLVSASASVASAQRAELGTRSTAALAHGCNAGDDAACREVVRRFHANAEVPADRDEGRELLEQICLTEEYVPHSASAAEFRAAMRRSRPCRRALAAYLRASCDAGLSMDCVRLATQIEHGMGVRRSLRTARALVAPVCESASDPLARGSACEMLGRFYEEGLGVARDPSRAIAFFERACESIPSSCGRLGALHAEGALGPVDPDAARRAYRRSCDAGIPHSCNALRALE